MLQASALPAAPRASAAVADATPRMRTVRAVREDMDTIALRGMRNCGGFQGLLLQQQQSQETHRSIRGG
ncbi:hypothetical protein GCM10022207_70460 [Streptomyces lannensis]|uniref:Uncharacterized protein n=1 Tax=Streptomyces lannensis TaxID=766498 RepID=A0ABP7L0J2_9ACTN